MRSLDDELVEAALGGRVRSTPFLSPQEADRTLAAVRARGVSAGAWGGFPGAVRRVVTAWPDHVPDATPALAALYVAGAEDEDALRAALRASGLRETDIGDVVRHLDGLSVVVLGGRVEALVTPLSLAGRSVRGESVGLDRLARGSQRRLEAVVPALRLDALGAKAFGVSRSYFAKGVRAGRVRIDGAVASASDDVAPGAEVWADGLGRFRLLALEGETKRGNLRVRLEVERS